MKVKFFFVRCATCVCLYTHTANIFFSPALLFLSFHCFFLSSFCSVVRTFARSFGRSYTLVWHVLLLLIYWICYKLNIHFSSVSSSSLLFSAYAKHMCDYCFISVCKLTKYILARTHSRRHINFSQMSFVCAVCVFYWHGILEWICFRLTKIHDIIPSAHYLCRSIARMSLPLTLSVRELFGADLLGIKLYDVDERRRAS